MTVAELSRLVELAEGRRVLEIGAYQGMSTIMLAQVAELVVSVDWHRGDSQADAKPTLAQYMLNLYRYRVIDRVVPVIADVANLDGLFATSFGLVFIDGFHTYEAVKADLGRFAALAPVVALHDFGREDDEQFPKKWRETFGVSRACRELLGEPTEVVGTLAVYA